MRILEDFINQSEDNENGLIFYTDGNVKVVSNEDANKRLKEILIDLGVSFSIVF